MVYLAACAGLVAQHSGSFDEGENVINAFHFLRPLWLVAMPLLWILVFWLARRRKNDGDWSGFIDAELLQALRLDAESSSGMRPWPTLALLWSLAVLALAGPSWEHDQTAAYRAPASWVFVLDLSPSMQTADVLPNRITRARYALDDLLGAAHDARVGLVAFSDEAYAVTPLTEDVATVRALLPPLAPDIMPSPGDHLAPALEQAEKLFQPGGNQRIVVLTDGFDDPAAGFSAAARLKARGITVSVIGIGKNAHNSEQQLANTGGGMYADIAQLPVLINYLQSVPHSAGVAAEGVEVSHWRDAGVWLLPLLLLLASLLARRGWL